MGFIGTFIKGAITGVIGLGIVSWLYSTVSGEDKEESSQEEE